jgi:hypothetical protein
VEFDTTNPNKEFNFNDYSQAVVSMINGSYEKFSVGIYGEWGTGKTTLMKLVEKNLRPHVFNWKNVPGEESVRLKNFLQKNFDELRWIDDPNIDFEKSADKRCVTISSDKRKNPTNSLSITRVEKRKATVDINNQKVYEFFVEEDKVTHNLSIRENNILTVWFNAWRYEREEQFALIPLMKTIAYAMGEHPIYKDIKPILIRGLEILSKDILRNLATRYVMTAEGFKELEEKLIPKLEKLPDIDKDTIYFDGIKKIEDEIQKIFVTYPNSRIVVFIDDLDRCSLETALEVFESIKVFLEIDGFVFIIGLSREALDKLIKTRYEKMGLTDIDPNEYIRKIIQIDINIQKWTNDAIKDLIYKLSKKVDEKYSKQILDNIELITEGVKPNPRKVKQFINRFVISLTVNSSLEARKFLVGEILKDGWYDFYRYLTNETFVKLINGYLKKREEGKGEEFLTELENKAKDKDHPLDEFEKIILLYKGDSTLWEFFDSYREIIFGKEAEGKESNITRDWQKYQNVSGSTNIPIIHATSQQYKSSAFVIMPFNAEMNELYIFGINQVLQENGLLGQRADILTSGGNVQEQIRLAIESSALVIAEVSEYNLNVFFEIGYAWGVRRPVILIAKKGTPIPFEVRAERVILYDSLTDLRRSLSEELANIRSRGII